MDKLYCVPENNNRAAFKLPGRAKLRAECGMVGIAFDGLISGWMLGKWGGVPR